MSETRTRKTPVQEVAESARIFGDLQSQTDAWEVVFHADIRKALKAGESATEVAKAAGLSRQRIYQIRDGRR